MKVWKLLDYQRRWVQDPAPVKICLKSRRIGISWSEAYDATMEAGAEGGGSTTYLGYNLGMTRGWVGDCAEWAHSLHRLSLHIGHPLLEDGAGGRPAYRLSMPSGAAIEGVASTPHALRSRGRPGDRAVLDEAAFHPDVDGVLGAGMAYLVWGGRLRIISTSNGAEGAFAKLIEEVRAGELPYSLHTITFRDALAGGLYRRRLAIEAEAALRRDPGRDPGGVAREFEWSPEREAEWEASIRAMYRYSWQAEEELDCIAAPGAGAWIGLDDYLAAEHPDAGAAERYAGGPAFIGYDVARRRDLAVIAVLERAGGVLWLRELVEMHQETFAAQREEIARAMGAYRVVRVAVDQTGMGEVQTEELQRKHGARRVEGVQLTSARRLGVASALREAFEGRLLRVPRDRRLRLDVRSVRRGPSAAGQTRLYSDTSALDSHADRFWALALAVSAAGPGDGRYAAHRVDNRLVPERRLGRIRHGRPMRSRGGALGRAAIRDHGFLRGG